MAKRKIDRKMLAEYLAEHTVKETAEHFGTAASYVYSMARESGLRYLRQRDRFDVSDGEFIEYVETHTAEEAEEHFGMKYPTLRSRCKRLGARFIRKRKWPFLYEREFWERNKVKTLKEVAEENGVCMATVRLARETFKDVIDFRRFRRPKRQNAERDEMILFLAGKYSLTSIAAAFNVSRERVRQIVEREEKTE